MEAYHYPPELLALLVDTIPRLVRSKKDVLLFFRGAGVDDADMLPAQARLASEPSVTKFDLVRMVLTAINERQDAAIRPRREVLKRVCEFEDFSTSWPNDVLKAKGLVGEVRKVIDVKDSFTRMRQEKDNAQAERRRERERELAAKQEKRDELARIKRALFALFSMTDPWKRGKALEKVLNDLFKAAGISVREAFTLKGNEAQGIVEQIDGVIGLDGHVYLVEMKWKSEALDVNDVSRHAMRVFSRDGARGVFISASGFGAAAIDEIRGALRQRVFAFCDLSEFVTLLEAERDLAAVLKAKVDAAIVEKNPYHRSA